MTITCKRCNQLILGPDAPPDLIDAAQRAAYEYRAIYPLMANHILKEHTDSTPMLVALVDQYALALFGKYFTASDEAMYEEIHARSGAAAWVTLSQPFNVFPTLTVPPSVPKVQKTPPAQNTVSPLVRP